MSGVSGFTPGRLKRPYSQAQLAAKGLLAGFSQPRFSPPDRDLSDLGMHGIKVSTTQLSGNTAATHSWLRRDFGPDLHHFSVSLPAGTPLYAQGTPTQSHVSPSILVYEEKMDHMKGSSVTLSVETLLHSYAIAYRRLYGSSTVRLFTKSLWSPRCVAYKGTHRGV